MTHDNDLVSRAEVLELVKAMGKDWAENGQPVARLFARDLADSIDAIRSALTTEAGDVMTHPHRDDKLREAMEALEQIADRPDYRLPSPQDIARATLRKLKGEE
ncbi:hypothetical protein PE067_09530 [Paracoccus sp. DMF-8]|uniref:hypothetical protein n=1 Tax=Paracoccus sp. DMF-8 TaxID=3019445 RepID=UPI0023E80381|nr:hypothetical protein [Paracoccus sp. DMF-8]MDF3606360.1 hypothetical protein [Paracoccus sp. DMF-8]